MKFDPFLRSAGPPYAGDPMQRVFLDYGRDIMEGRPKLRLPVAAPRSPETQLKASSRLSRLWELTAMLHCSIIGTCLPPAEIRALLRRARQSVDAAATDHDLHSLAV